MSDKPVQASEFEHLLGSDLFTLVADTRQQLEKISKKAGDAVKQNYKTPESLKGFIEAHGTPVYILQGNWFTSLYQTSFLKSLGFSHGYIPKPSSPEGVKRYRKLVSWLTRNEEKSLIYFDATRFEQGLFLVPSKQYNVPYLSHQVHHWMACRAGLEGYSDSAQELYRKFWDNHRGEVTPRLLKSLGTSEVLELKQAINRDMEALKFLQSMVEEVFAPANQKVEPGKRL